MRRPTDLGSIPMATTMDLQIGMTKTPTGMVSATVLRASQIATATELRHSLMRLRPSILRSIPTAIV